MINARAMFFIGIINAFFGFISMLSGSDGYFLLEVGCILISIAVCVEEPPKKQERMQVRNHYLIVRGNRSEIERMKEVMFPILKKMGKPTDPEGALSIDLGQAALEQGDLEMADKYATRGFELGQKKCHEHLCLPRYREECKRI